MAPSRRRPSLGHRAPGWLFSSITAVGAAGLLWSETYPYGSVPVFIASAGVVAICAAVWLVRLIIYLSGRSSYPSGRAWPFLVAPVGGAAVLLLGFTSLPLHARWSMSQGAFDAQADELVERVERTDAAPGQNLLRDDHIALYEVSYAHVDGDGNVFFSIANSGFIDTGGFARIPGGQPPDSGDDQFEHLDGDWYLWLSRFD